MAKMALSDTQHAHAKNFDTDRCTRVNAVLGLVEKDVADEEGERAEHPVVSADAQVITSLKRALAHFLDSSAFEGLQGLRTTA